METEGQSSVIVMINLIGKSFKKVFVTRFPLKCLLLIHIFALNFLKNILTQRLKMVSHMTFPLGADLLVNRSILVLFVTILKLSAIKLNVSNGYWK